MEEKENFGFCPACGATLPENSAFCPECGRSVAEAETQPNTGYGYATSSPYAVSPKERMQGKVLVAFIFIVIYAAMSILGGISLLGINEATIDQLDDMLKDSGQSFEDILESAGLDMTKSEFVDFCMRSGIVSLVSGVLAAVGAVLVAKHTKRMAAVIIIVAASLVNFVLVMDSGFFSCLLNAAIGCIMAYLIYSSPEAFRDE